MESSPAVGAGRPVAIYCNTLASGRGAERVIYNLLIALTKEGKRCDLLLDDMEGDLLAELRRQAPGIRVELLRGSDGQESLSHAYCIAALVVELVTGLVAGKRFDDFKGLVTMVEKERPPLLALRRYLSRENPAVVMSFLNDANIALMLTACLSKGDSRFIPNVRNHISAGASALQSKRMRALPKAMRRLFSRADAVVVPAEDIRRDVVSITGLSPERIVRILNPIDLADVGVQATEDPEHPWLAETADVPVVLAAGKMKPQKDFPTLLRAFAELRERQACRLIVLGNGPLEGELLSLAESLGVADDVAFPGHVGNPFAYLARSQLFVLSSAWEGLPNVLIEALACGCPIVSTDSPGGASEILEGGRYGRLVPVGDAAAMAAAMEESLAAPPQTEDLRRRAADFSVERAAKAYGELLFGIEAG